MEIVGRNTSCYSLELLTGFLGGFPTPPTSPVSAGSARGRQRAWCYVFILKQDSFPHKCFEEGV